MLGQPDSPDLPWQDRLHNHAGLGEIYNDAEDQKHPIESDT